LQPLLNAFHPSLAFSSPYNSHNLPSHNVNIFKPANLPRPRTPSTDTLTHVGIIVFAAVVLIHNCYAHDGVFSTEWLCSGEIGKEKDDEGLEEERKMRN
jgi:hypothetical protein